MRLCAIRYVVLGAMTPAAFAAVTMAGGPVGTAFTYQGQLKDAGQPANGSYDLLFSLYNVRTDGTPVVEDVPIDDWAISNGLFSVQLDFRNGTFTGQALWLEVAVRPGASEERYTVLSPRQAVTPAPYALYALSGPESTGGFWAENGSDIHNTNSGNVGIGTMNPASRLHVLAGEFQSAIRASGTLLIGKGLDESGTGLSVSRTTATNPLTVSVRTEIDGNHIDAFGGLFGTGDVDLLLNTTSTGHVGIGTNSPVAALDVRQSTDDTALFVQGAGLGQAHAALRVESTQGMAASFTSVGPQTTLVVENDTTRVDLCKTVDVPLGTLPLSGLFFGSVIMVDNLTVGGGLSVSGTLSKGGGSFKIDHPTDPVNKYLYHSFVESPDMMNVYNGNVVTDERGYATVALPDYFEALNRDFRYQLTMIDEIDNDVFVQVKLVRKIKGNVFTLRTSHPNVEVSWQVTGVRKDAWAERNRIPVEQEKPDYEKGLYLHPELYGRPPEKGVHFVNRTVKSSNGSGRPGGGKER